jgi:hypothetical protein
MTTPQLPTEPVEDSPRGFVPDEVQAVLIRNALTEAGVELGAYDERMIAWLAGWDWSTVATIASWVGRAAAADALPGAVLPPPDPARAQAFHDKLQAEQAKRRR